MKICFIGAGKMASAIAKGLLSEQLFKVDDICASDIFDSARKQFSELTGAQCHEDNAIAIKDASTVILSVKPQEAEKVLAPLKAALEGKLLISIAAGLKIDRLQEWTGLDRVIRVMPNTPAMVNLGASVYSPSKSATAEDKALAQSIFEAIGIAYEMPEEKLDAVTALSGSGPAYLFAYIEAMVAAATKLGLETDAALNLTVQTIAGAAEMLKQDLGTPEALRAAVTSKGGTTFAGLESLRADQFEQVIDNCLQAASKRSIELGS